MWLKVPLLQTKHILFKYKPDLLHLAKNTKTISINLIDIYLQWLHLLLDKKII